MTLTACNFQGPPGTGKTKTILGLLSIIMAAKVPLGARRLTSGHHEQV